MKKLMMVLGVVGAIGAWAFVTQMGQAEAYRMEDGNNDVTAETVAARDQSMAKADALLTEKIRTAILADTHLSEAAKSVNIVTIAGVVTLSGRVATDREKASVGAKALRAAGGRRIHNKVVSDEL